MNSSTNNILKLAIQKSGRLSEKSLEYIKSAGVSFRKDKNKLRAVSSNFPIELLFLRDDDIPGYVETGVADIGIVGENVLEEVGSQVRITERMGFSKCRLSLAIPQSEAYIGAQSLQGKTIATSYPNLLRKFLEKSGVTAKIHEISGSVEIAPGIGLADAICDLVSTGTTLRSNGLKEVEVIFKSEAVLIQNQTLDAEKQAILDKLLFRFRSVLRAVHYKYILMNVPEGAVEKICNVLPGMRSPTIVPLSEAGWFSLHTVVKENEFWEVIDNLKEAGAEGILVTGIEKMIL
ncbi:MAG: ATP phosphoribosyltransferase [Bacteroidota bacterium]